MSKGFLDVGLIAMLLFIGFTAVSCQSAPVEQTAVPTATATERTTSTPTQTAVSTATATASPTLTPTPLPTATATPISISPQTLQLVVTDGEQLALLDADGEWQTLVMDNRPGYPKLAPNGRFVVYTSNANDWPSQLVLIDLDGGEPMTLAHTSDQFVLSADWSPDGQMLVFSADFETIGQTPGLYLVALDDPTTVMPLLLENGRFIEPAWSPDGLQIALAADGAFEGGFNIFLLDVEDGELHPVTRMAGQEREPVWSPDGVYLAFVADAVDGSGQKVTILHRDQFGNPEPTFLQLNHSGSASNPVWSQDGQLIGFVVDGALWLSDLEGNLQPVPLENADIWHMDWQFINQP